MATQASQMVMQRTRAVIKSVFNNMKGSPSTFRSPDELGLAGFRQPAFVNNVLRRLVENKVLVRQLRQVRHGRLYEYASTPAGWQLLEMVDSFPIEDLHAKFGVAFTPIERKRIKGRAQHLPHPVEVQTLVGGSPEGKAMIANQKHLLERVNRLTAEVDDLKARLIELGGPLFKAKDNAVLGSNGHAPYLPPDILQAIGEAFIKRR